MKLSAALLAVLAMVCLTHASRRTSYNPCQAAQAQTAGEEHCGNNGIIFPNRDAFECAKLTNSRLRKISCNDSLILAKKALGNIREQNNNGQLLTQREKIQRMRERHEQARQQAERSG